MNASAVKRGLALGFVGWLAGCTQMTVRPIPDAGPPRDAGIDAAVEDGGVLPPPVIETCTPEGMDSTLGEACATDQDCDDGCYCNGVERCEAGACVAGADPCPDEVDCTADVCLEEANRCFHEPQHELCSNGNACDGIEICDLANGCSPGAPPYCNDETSCTLDSCDPEIGCVFQARDLDGDGFTDGRCGGDDCDDDPRFGRDIFPGATEDCTNRRDDDCDGLRDYNDLDCVPTNDTCESAVVLPGPGTYSGATRGLASDFTLSCRSAQGPDAVFRFALDEPQDVTVTISGGGTGAGVALRPWAQCASGADEKCSNGSPPSFLRRSLPAGEYAIIVQSNGGGAAFDLSLRVDPPTDVPPIDVCNAETEDLCGGVPCAPMTRTVTGMFADTGDQYELGCGGSGRSDAAYRFTLDRTMDVTIRGSAGWTTYVALTTDCNSPGAERRCETGNPSEVRQRELPPGTYYVLLESSSTTNTSYSLEATFADPLPRTPGDACSAPIDISEPVLGMGGMGSVVAASLDFDSGTSCGGSTGSFRDATFRFTLPETRDVTLTTEIGVTWSTYNVSLQTACGDPSSDLRCWSGSGELGQSWRSLPAGDYFVTISTTNTTGNVSARLVTRPPTAIPPNDRCEGAIALSSGVSQSGSTIGFEDDVPSGTCTSGSRPDALYTFTLAQRSTAVISVRDADDPATTTFWLTLRDAPCGSGTQRACTSGTTATINTLLEPGTYYLQVESNSTDTSDFVIFPSFFPAP